MGTIQSRKMAVNFTLMRHRPGCGNCEHCQREDIDPMQHFRHPGLVCVRYGFGVTDMSICDRHTQTKPVTS